MIKPTVHLPRSNKWLTVFAKRRNPVRLSEKVAIVTGGASGIGRGIAFCLAEEGALVVVADINFAGAKKVEEEIGSSVAFSVPVDVTKTDSLDAMIGGVLRQFGRIDILVNNAGIDGPLSKPFYNAKEEDWDRMWDVNFKSVVRATNLMAPYFEKQGKGRIINISSQAAFLPQTLNPAYAESKAAVVNFTRVAAWQLAPFGVTVNAIAPGLVWTPHWERLAAQLKNMNPEIAQLSPREIFDKFARETVPLKREQTPEDVGRVAVFLASEDARSITGQVIHVDGGRVMR